MKWPPEPQPPNKLLKVLLLIHLFPNKKYPENMWPNIFSPIPMSRKNLTRIPRPMMVLEKGGGLLWKMAHFSGIYVKNFSLANQKKTHLPNLQQNPSFQNCWWFRNPKQPPGIYKSLCEEWDIFTMSTGDRRISEPPTVSPRNFNIFNTLTAPVSAA